MSLRLFTKSAFKVALSCPWKLYYYRNPEVYANANAENDFLESLAEGGFQVGELAKYYCGVDEGADLKDLMGYDESLARTAELMQRENVTIAEAAFKFDNMFVRVDILKKRGNSIELIEVKAKSWNPEKDSFIGKRPKGSVSSGIRPYVYDVAFQKYVVTQALPDYNVCAYLMMADKTKCADIDGINQLFKIGKNAQGRTEAKMVEGALDILNTSKTQVLTAFDVDEICDNIIAGKTTEQLTTQDNPVMLSLGFKKFVRRAAECYCNNTPFPNKPVLCGSCIKCEFHKTGAANELDMKDGKRECWCQYVSDRDYDNRPLIEKMNGADLGANRDKWIRSGLYFMDELGPVLKTYNEKKVDEPGLDGYQRKWLQIGLETNNASVLSQYKPYLKGTSYIDTDGLREEMAKWKYPLHMIDFETTSVALPYYKGMKPYDQVAFQFSHHVIYEDGTIEHIGQYLNEDVTKFPNFEFVRTLKKQLEGDEGTIFRYANHENTILRIIAEQLSNSKEPDKEELIAFIRSITHSNEKGKEYSSDRDMVDLLQVVKHYFYNLEEMHGSNSIKQVLPAVLNSSKYLKDKYSQPIYGSEIKSLNIKPDEPLAWVTFEPDGHVDSPYHQLASVGELIDMSQDEMDQMEHLCQSEDDFTVANGGAALTAYNKLMFCDDTVLGTLHYGKLREALLRYCELDTMSMVFIWEYFMHESMNLNK